MTPGIVNGDQGAAFHGGPIVIIGGGIIGCSLAFHLAKLGHTDVTVVEAGSLGEGATCKATGGIRQQFSSPINARLAHEAVTFFTHFEDLVGEPFEFRQHGYLFLLGTEEQARQFERDAEVQRSLGIDVRLLSPDQVTDIVPGVRTDDLQGAAYTPTDGSASPTDAVAAFARQARRRGVRIEQHTKVTGIGRGPDGRVAHVTTTNGRLPAEVVVNAAGPWARTVGDLVDLSLPIEPHPRQAFGIAPIAGLDASLPLTVDMVSGAYVHPEAAGGIVGGNDRDVAASFDATVRWDLTELLVEALTHRFTWMADAAITTGWCGLREMTPDDHAIIGPDGPPGWWNVVGFSGHGFMQAPVVGDQVARWILGEEHQDFSDLRLSRFERGGVNYETTVF